MSQERIENLEEQLSQIQAELAELKLSRAQKVIRSLRRKRRAITGAIGCLIFIPIAVHAFTIPNTFIAGTPTVAADVNANFTAIKDQFDVMENKSWRLIYELDVSSNMTTLTVTPVNGNLDKAYWILGRYVNNSGATQSYFVRPNGDNTLNYGSTYIYGASSAVGSGTSTANFQDGLYHCYSLTATQCEATSTMIAVSGAFRSMQTQFSYNVTPGYVGGIELFGSTWNNSIANITSLEITSSAANGIGAGSHIEVWARR
jgi:hypothetical protein